MKLANDINLQYYMIYLFFSLIELCAARLCDTDNRTREAFSSLFMLLPHDQLARSVLHNYMKIIN